MEFIIKNDRIYSVGDPQEFAHKISGDTGTTVLVSTKADGTDRELAYYVSALPDSGSGRGCSVLTARNWVYYYEGLEKDGSTKRFLHWTTSGGTARFPVEKPEFDGLPVMALLGYGEEACICTPLQTCDLGMFRLVDGQLQETDISGLELAGAYLFGNTLRIFKPGNGYYDVDLTTREEAFLAPAQMKNSKAMILQPNCIIETTLLSQEYPGTAGHQMRLFDGEKWRTVCLPEELKHSASQIWSTGNGYAVNSDSIFVYVVNRADYTADLYRIPLTDGELKAEFCAKLRS
jgi:hypothetical protein